MNFKEVLLDIVGSVLESGYSPYAVIGGFHYTRQCGKGWAYYKDNTFMVLEDKIWLTYAMTCPLSWRLRSMYERSFTLVTQF